MCGENLRVATSIRDDETRPAEVRLRAIGSINRTLDRLAKLLGLDAGSRLLTGVVEAAVSAMTAEQEREELIAFGLPGLPEIQAGPEHILPPVEGAPADADVIEDSEW